MQKSAIVMAVTSTGMVFALVADLLIALKFGTSGRSDMLIIGISLPLFFDTVIREGSKFSILPWLTKAQNDFSEHVYNMILSSIIIAFTVLSLGVGALVVIFANKIISFLAPSYNKELISVGTDILRASSLVIAFSIPNTLLSAHLNANEKFYVVALRNTVAPASLIVAFLVFWSGDQLLLIAGSCYSVAALVYFLVLARAAISTGYSFKFVVQHDYSTLKEVFVLVSLPILGFLSLQGSRIAVRMMATQIGVGSVAAFYFAFRIASAVQTTIGVSIATTGLPRMANRYLKGEYGGMSDLRRPILLSVSLALVAMAGVWLISDWFFAIIAAHVRTEQFEPTSVADTLKYLSIGFVFTTLLPIVQSVLYAQSKVSSVVRNMVFNAVVAALASLILYPICGLRGLAIAYVLAALLSLLEVLIAVRRVRYCPQPKAMN